MKDGYIRVASASIDTLIGNVKHNANEIKKKTNSQYQDNPPLVFISISSRFLLS